MIQDINNPKPLTIQDIESHLSNFCGTEKYYRLSQLFPNIFLTDGTQAAGDILECFWLFELIAIAQRKPKIADNKELMERIQFWKLKTDIGAKKATLYCEQDTDQIVFQQKITYTDMRLPEFKVWVQPLYYPELIGQVFHLPSEY